MATSTKAKQSSQARQGPQPRVLRIGVILGGNIVEERLMRERADILVGQSAKNTFSVPIEGLPKSWPLFVLKGEDYVLRFTDRMDGRVSVGGNVRTLDSLRGKEAQSFDGHYEMPLDKSARGKIEVGEMKLLFQFVAAPPLQPRPRLPASVRGSLIDRIDPQLAIILALSLIMHFTIALVAFNHDPPASTKLEKRYQQFQEDSFKERVVTMKDETPTEPTSDDSEAGGDENKTDDKPATAKKPDSGGDTSDGGDDQGAPDQAQFEERVRESPVMASLGFGESDNGLLSRANDTDQGVGLNAAIDDVKKSGGKVDARGSADDRRARGQGGSGIAGEKGPGKIDGPSGGTKVTPKKEEKIKSRAKFSVDDLGDSTLSADDVTRRIRSRYLRGIKSCHNRLLKVNPTAGGRVSLRFTVGASGKVTSARAKGFDSGVDSCISGLMRKWRFGAPKDEDGNPSSASFAVPLVLKPGT